MGRVSFETLLHDVNKGQGVLQGSATAMGFCLVRVHTPPLSERDQIKCKTNKRHALEYGDLDIPSTWSAGTTRCGSC